MRPALGGLVIASALGLAGCVGPPALHDSVLGYDETVSALEQEILLLNVARLSTDRPPHFTLTSSIAASFTFETASGIGVTGFEGQASDSLSLSLQQRAAENPTFSIVPISGQEFTSRILTPVKEDVFAFFAFQGVRIELLGRLMADGIEMFSANGQSEAFYFNKVTSPEQFRAFRQVVLHLGGLQANNQLFVTQLTYDQVILDRVRQQPNTGDIVGALAGGLTWRQNGDETYTLSRAVRGRVLISNYDPRNLANADRQRLDAIASRSPDNFVLIDVRPDFPGGAFPIFGALKLRSLFAMLDFVGKSIELFPEVPVEADPRSPAGARNPLQTLAIDVSAWTPDPGAGRITYEGRTYAIADTRWDRVAFMVLYELFQVTVTDVSRVGIPITIAK